MLQYFYFSCLLGLCIAVDSILSCLFQVSYVSKIDKLLLNINYDFQLKVQFKKKVFSHIFSTNFFNKYNGFIYVYALTSLNMIYNYSSEKLVTMYHPATDPSDMHCLCYTPSDISTDTMTSLFDSTSCCTNENGPSFNKGNLFYCKWFWQQLDCVG